MKYALLFVGVLLVATGGYFVYTGSNVIEIERGWSSVIAGATVLSAGIVTLGLAGVVKALDDVKQLLRDGRLEFADSTTLGRSFAAAGAAPDLVADLAPMPIETSALDTMSEQPPAFTDFAPRSVGSEVRRRTAKGLDFEISDFNAPPTAPAHDPADIASAPGLPRSSRRDFDSYSEPESEDIPHADMDEDATDLSPFETVYGEAPPLDETFDPPASEPAFGTPRPKAIGRYEAGGTLYVMYSDGSIEAQTPRETRYFKSMADLKESFQP